MTPLCMDVGVAFFYFTIPLLVDVLYKSPRNILIASDWLVSQYFDLLFRLLAFCFSVQIKTKELLNGADSKKSRMNISMLLEVRKQ